MSSPPQTLLDALNPKPLGEDRFEARSIEYLRHRVFAGLARLSRLARRTWVAWRPGLAWTPGMER